MDGWSLSLVEPLSSAILALDVLMGGWLQRSSEPRSSAMPSLDGLMEWVVTDLNRVALFRRSGSGQPDGRVVTDLSRATLSRLAGTGLPEGKVDIDRSRATRVRSAGSGRPDGEVVTEFIRSPVAMEGWATQNASHRRSQDTRAAEVGCKVNTCAE